MNELRPIAEALVNEWVIKYQIKAEAQLIDAVIAHLTARKNREVKAAERQIFTLFVAARESRQK